jgi:hypothetical protein
MHCPICRSELPAEARYCMRCGRPLPRPATGATQRLGAAGRQPSLIGDWFRVEGCALCVHDMRDELVFDSGLPTPTEVRSLRLLVEYVNDSPEPLAYRLSQWRLYDRAGFSYEFELRNQFYAENAPHRLVEGLLGPGRRVRGWVAFQLPTRAEADYVQFMPSYSAKAIAEVALGFPLD